MIKQVLFLIIFTINLVSTHLFSQENNKIILTLPECEKLAFQNNIEIQSAKLSLKTSEAKLTQASNAKYLPKFELSNVWGTIPKARGVMDPSGGFVISPDSNTSIPGDLRLFTQIDLDLLQPIYTFGKLGGLADAATFGVQADQAKVEKEREDVRLQVRQLYWALVLGKELLAVVQNADSELKKAENKVQEKLDEGSDEISQTDLFKLRIFRYQINKNKRQTLDKIELAKSALKATLGIEANVDIEVDAEYLDPLQFQLDSLNGYYEMAIQNRAEFAQFKAGMGAKKALIGVTRSDYFPQFFLGGQIKFNYAQDRFDPKGPYIYNPTNFFRPGVVLGMKLNMNFLQTRDKVRVAQAEYRQLAQKERLLLDGLKLDVQKSYLELQQANKNMQESRNALKASDNWLRSATMTFDIGVGEVKELIDAFKANGAMQAEHFQNIFTYNIALAKLSKATGSNLYAVSSEN